MILFNVYATEGCFSTQHFTYIGKFLGKLGLGQFGLGQSGYEQLGPGLWTVGPNLPRTFRKCYCFCDVLSSTPIAPARPVATLVPGPHFPFPPPCLLAHLVEVNLSAR